MFDHDNASLSELSDYLARISPDGFKLFVGIRAGRIDCRINGLRGAWRRTYCLRSYRFADPIIAWGLHQTGQHVWNDLEDCSQGDPGGVFAAARRHGIAAMAGVSVARGYTRSIAALVSRAAAFDMATLRDLEDRLAELQTASGQTRSAYLTPGEIEALHLISTGAHICQVAYQLGISESAVKLRLASARKRLGAPTTIAAIHSASVAGLL